MRSFLRIQGLLLFFLVGCATQVKENDEINPKTYAQTITVSELKNYLTTFASDEFEGRKTGEPGQKKAAAFLEKQYQKMDISFPSENNGYAQKIPALFLKKDLKASENVLAYIAGSEFPDQIVIVSAHYDHLGVDAKGQVYNGADDDGSGTVALLEIAQAFKKATQDGHRPKRSLLFLHLTGEEEGLLGSRYYTEHPIFPLKNTVTNLNTDMIGRVDAAHQKKPNYIYLIGSDKLSSELDRIVNLENKEYTQLNLDYTFNAKDDPNRFYFRSDHYNFAKHNIPVIFFFSGVHEDYHKVTDTADKINYPLMTKRAKLIFYTAWKIANQKERLSLD